MADGFTLQIDDDLAREIERAAEAAGMSREDYARFLLTQQTSSALFDDAPQVAAALETSEDGARDWDEFEAELRQEIAERRRERT